MKPMKLIRTQTRGLDLPYLAVEDDGEPRIDQTNTTDCPDERAAHWDSLHARTPHDEIGFGGFSSGPDSGDETRQLSREEVVRAGWDDLRRSLDRTVWGFCPGV